MNWKIVLRFSLVLACSGCEGGQSGGTEVRKNPSPEVPMHDIGRLGKVIDLSKVVIDSLGPVGFEVLPIGVENSRVPGPIDDCLVAVFKVQSLDSAEVEPIGTIASPLDRGGIAFREWLPSHVKDALFSPDRFRPIVSYSAKIFYRSPYLQGFFVRLDDGMIYLQLQTQ
jgi:hypothetical protein